MNLDRAIEIATNAHQGQTREGGATYLTHVLRVVQACEHHGEEAQVVAALHDVVEDSDWTLADLRREGLAEQLIAAVDAITRRACPWCRGKGKELHPVTLEAAESRIADAFPMFTLDAVRDIAKLALADITDRVCRVCEGASLEKREDYLERVKADALARKVKIADATDNRDDDGRKGMFERYTWVLAQLGVSSEPKGEERT